MRCTVSVVSVCCECVACMLGVVVFLPLPGSVAEYGRRVREVDVSCFSHLPQVVRSSCDDVMDNRGVMGRRMCWVCLHGRKKGVGDNVLEENRSSLDMMMKFYETEQPSLKNRIG